MPGLHRGSGVGFTEPELPSPGHRGGGGSGGKKAKAAIGSQVLDEYGLPKMSVLQRQNTMEFMKSVHVASGAELGFVSS